MRVLYLLLLFASLSPIFGETLRLLPEDLHLDQSMEGGFLLRVRRKPGIGAVLITESTKDPALKAAVYGLRNPRYHPVNGNERRILDGELLVPNPPIYFLLDSSPESDDVFGEAFHIFIPYVVEFGYAWTRNGDLLIHDGAFINIRTFAKPFADYTGGFTDNPFLIRVVQVPSERPVEGGYLDDTVDAFQEIARVNDGRALFSSGEANVIDRIEEILQRTQGSRLDLVLAIDTTRSMKNDIPFLKDRLVPLLNEYRDAFPELRVGLIYYRDYGEEYLTRVIDFRDDLGEIQQEIDRIEVSGGGDIPEAVYEGLYHALEQFLWQAEARQIILIGDAPPHAKPRGAIDSADVFERAQEMDVQLNTIILPQ